VSCLRRSSAPTLLLLLLPSLLPLFYGRTYTICIMNERIVVITVVVVYSLDRPWRYSREMSRNNTPYSLRLFELVRKENEQIIWTGKREIALRTLKMYEQCARPGHSADDDNITLSNRTQRSLSPFFNNLFTFESFNAVPVYTILYE